MGVLPAAFDARSITERVPYAPDLVQSSYWYRVGFDALVGSGCFLSRDLPDLTIAVGNPSREIDPVTRIKLEDGVSPAYPWRHRFQRGYPEELTQKWVREADELAAL